MTLDKLVIKKAEPEVIDYWKHVLRDDVSELHVINTTDDMGQIICDRVAKIINDKFAKDRNFFYVCEYVTNEVGNKIFFIPPKQVCLPDGSMELYDIAGTVNCEGGLFLYSGKIKEVH